MCIPTMSIEELRIEGLLGGQVGNQYWESQSVLALGVQEKQLLIYQNIKDF